MMENDGHVGEVWKRFLGRGEKKPPTACWSVFISILKQDIEFTIYGKMSNILPLSYPNKTGSSLKSHNILKTTISNSLKQFSRDQHFGNFSQHLS